MDYLAKQAIPMIERKKANSVGYIDTHASQSKVDFQHALRDFKEVQLFQILNDIIAEYGKSTNQTLQAVEINS